MDEKPIEALLRDEADEENAEDDFNAKAKKCVEELDKINKIIATGANQFLLAEYSYLALFCSAFAIIIGVTVDKHEIDRLDSPSNFPYTAVAFIIGSLISILAGYIGMYIATYTNARTTYQCCKGDLIDANVPADEP
jgi:Na+/H+-translocating membrane pyrophosphatase